MNKFILLLFTPCFLIAQNTFKMQQESKVTATKTTVDINEYINGTLQIPSIDQPVPLVILLTGSGPNDRDGNSMMTRNDSHKQLANALQDNNIATYRYDKRSYTLVKERKQTDDISFEDFIKDARTVVTHFENDPRFNKIFIAGHSQGSLVGLLAINENIDGFISLAGAADPIDAVVIEQLAAQSPGLDKMAAQVFEKMKTQDSLVTDVNPFLLSIVGPKVQPFMKSWMSYKPTDVIAKLKIPTLIINGTRDRQVSIQQAEKLHAALPQSQLIIIDGMDHLFKKVSKDDVEAAKSYIDPSFPLHEQLVTTMVQFIKS